MSKGLQHCLIACKYCIIAMLGCLLGWGRVWNVMLAVRIRTGCRILSAQRSTCSGTCYTRLCILPWPEYIYDQTHQCMLMWTCTRRRIRTCMLACMCTKGPSNASLSSLLQFYKDSLMRNNPLSPTCKHIFSEILEHNGPLCAWLGTSS